MLYVVFFTVFACYCYVLHRDLLSFPTRRSSDLRRCRLSSLTGDLSCFDTPTLALPLRGREMAGRGSRFPSPSRSEEHTSELQSLTNLVCRLLLEKKKKTQSSQILLLSHIPNIDT